MNPLHLIWIIGLSFGFGFMVAAVLSASGGSDDEL